jgi:hypothetical protein
MNEHDELKIREQAGLLAWGEFFQRMFVNHVAAQEEIAVLRAKLAEAEKKPE